MEVDCNDSVPEKSTHGNSQFGGELGISFGGRVMSSIKLQQCGECWNHSSKLDIEKL
jgi:hypothetical protein